MTPTQGLES